MGRPEAAPASGRDAAAPRGPEPSAVRRCVESIRRMILHRSLLPGEQIRQTEMAERLEVSRVPLREALKVLETEGVLVHSPNRGYFVARLRASELAQIYLMRQLLEGELYRSVEFPDEAGLDRLSEINEDMRHAIDNGEIEALVAANRAFHFAIFDLSPLNVVRREVERLWSLSDSYRAVYLYASAPRERILDEHEMVIQALRRCDRDALITISDHHRSGLQAHMRALLEPEPSERPELPPDQNGVQ